MSQIIGPDKKLGATTKHVEAAEQAYKDGADYLGVGAIYPTTTKVKTAITSVDTLKNICTTVPIPVVAIGGLNSDTILPLKGSLISGIAVVSAIMYAENPKEETLKLNNLIENLI